MILVIDIGMTHKKVAVYDEQLVQRDSAYKEFAPIMVRDAKDGREIPTHDIGGMRAWFSETIGHFAQQYDIKTISVTTHGATFVCVDENGDVCAPCVSYTYEPGDAFQKRFYEKCGSPEKLQAETFTPRFTSLLNAAKGIMFLQEHFASQFAHTVSILGFPQYWTFLFTGQKVCESTYLSCHSYLWNQNEHTWSSVVDSLNIRNYMPQTYVPTCSIIGTVTERAAKEFGLAQSVTVAAGIHDSNASLLPYIVSGRDKDFMLNSTGTWCVCMRQDSSKKNESMYAFGDIGKMVFFNRSAFDKPVKTTIFAGGMQIDSYVSLYQKINKTDVFPSSDIDAAETIFKEKRLFLLPGLLRGSGMFPNALSGIYENGKFFPFDKMNSMEELPQVFFDEKLFFALLDISLVIQTEEAVRRTEPSDATALYVEGGFRKNELYNKLLASVFPSNDMFLTNMNEATAMGCAMGALISNDAADGNYFKQLVKIERIPVAKSEIHGYEAYKTEWLKLAENEVSR